MSKRLETVEIDVAELKEAMDIVECDIWSLSGSPYNGCGHHACTDKSW